MSFIKLIRLDISGPNDNFTEIEFGNKATIIAGPSDTGKTCIFKCIDYVLGAKNDEEHAPFDKEDGYDTIRLLIDTSYGCISLKREVGSNLTYVSCNNTEIETGDYALDESKKNPKTINKLMLKILGLRDDLSVPKNKEGKPESFTWRSLKRAFFVDESRADQKKSILLPSTNDTPYLAGLIYFLTDNDLQDYLLKDEPKEIREAKKKAIIAYISNHKQEMLTKRNELASKLSASGQNADSISNLIAELNQQMLDINTEIEQLTDETKQTSSLLMKIQNKNQENKILFSNYNSLKNDYQKEIDRLSFIVQHEMMHNNIKKNTKCPYCDHDIISKNNESYIEASRIELRRVITNLNELDEISVNLKDSIDDDTDLIEVYEESIRNNKTRLTEYLLPQRQQIADTLKNYEEYIRLKSAIDQIDATDETLSTDLESYQKGKDAPRVLFEAKKLFYDILAPYIKENALSILTEMGYTDVNSIDFSETELDLVINNKKKSKRGKGYKAFTNSVLLLLFRKFIEERSAHKIGLFIFDSPLKGLSVPDEFEEDTDNIRKGFFNYIINLKTNDQIIIFENTKFLELPELDKNEDTKIYIFTQKENEGRYGFLNGVKKA